ncbi:MAG: sulfatase, partial [Candidatus Aminicenantes bacterium]|nr:sulfatase [Candidatus Aminicenantes bacterium]
MKLKINNVILALSSGFLVGAILGFFMAEIPGAISGIISNHYFLHRSYRLIAMILLFPFLKWFFYAFVTSLIFLILFYMIRRLRTGSLVINTGNNKKKIRIVLLPAQVILIFFLLTNAVFIVIHGSGRRDGPNVLIVVIDALREDTLGISGYGHNTSPEIDKFARNSVIFKNAYTSSSWTKPSVASLFSALHPVSHNTLGIKLKLPDELNTLAEVLKNDGYRTFFLGGGNPFIGSKFSFDQGFDHYFNKKSNAAGLSSRFSKLLPELKKGKFLAYLHYMDVHLPYNKNKFNYIFSSRRGNYKFIPGEIKRRGVRELNRKGELTENDKVELKVLYDGQIRYVDKHIGKLLEMLKSESLLKNTLVIITSDHGEEFWDHGG